MNRKIILGSRGSDLALWQAHKIEADLKALGAEVEIKIIKTRGDAIQHLSFDKIEGKGFFTKEIEEALLAKEIDLAVHSHKDLETSYPEGLTIAAVSKRENPADLLLIRKEKVDKSQKFGLVANAIVGTSSARRKSQMLHFCPGIEIKDIRGNVPTRIQKLRDGQFDAILLAYAGVKRLALDISEFEAVEMNVEEFIPAPAQGVLALQIRESDTDLFDLLQNLNDKQVAKCINVERSVLRLFDGGCQLPLGAYCKFENNTYKVYSSVASAWNTQPVYKIHESEEHTSLANTVLASYTSEKKNS